MPDQAPPPMDPRLVGSLKDTQRNATRGKPLLLFSEFPHQTLMPDQAPPPMDPRLVGSLAPSNPMDPQAVGGLNFPFVFAPGDGTRAGHFLPRGIVPEFYAKYTPQPAPPGYQHRRRSMISVCRFSSDFCKP
jgi:hypothetical protein